MTFVLWALVILCLCLGFLGCFVNKVPGPLAVLVAMAIAKYGCDVSFGWDTVTIVAVLAVASMILSKILVKLVKKMHAFNKRGAWGTTVGSIVGLGVLSSVGVGDSIAVVIIFAIACLVLLPFVFAFLFELTMRAGMEETTKCATAATASYLADSLLKLLVFGYAVYIMFLN